MSESKEMQQAAAAEASGMDDSFISTVDRYVSALVAGDAEAVAQALPESVILHVAVHDQAFEGRNAARVVFGFLFDGIFSNVRPRLSLADGNYRVVTLDLDVASYDGKPEALNLIRLGDTGALDEVTVFLRPLGALEALSTEMGRRFGGPRPQ